MIEIEGDLWDYLKYPDSVVCITTNGFIKKNGEAVMGRGVAAQAKDRFPELPVKLGKKIKRYGNRVQVILDRGGMAKKSVSSFPKIVAFPVKYNWWERADLDLIRISAKQLRKMAREWDGLHFYLPRPGCHNGRLNWEDVRPVLLSQLADVDNVIIVSLIGEE